MPELPLEPAAELRERGPGEVQPLEDERRPRLELREDAADVRGPAERRRPPGDALRVGVDVEFRAGLDEAKRGVAKAARAEKPLDVGGGEEVVETAFLGAGDDERLLLPVLGEEVLGRDRLDRAR
jgi:hypothetical protein